jgi:predicted RNase H-like nuclease
MLHQVKTASNESPASIIQGWIRNSQQVLLALDAPLGWPETLSKALSMHKAGQEIKADPNSLFRRETDRFLAEAIGKQPLDVGADRIARTAHSALKLLHELRNLTGCKIPLAWSPKLGERIESIEVYPAGTLTALELPNKGYKKATDEIVRSEIIHGLRDRIEISPNQGEALKKNADLLDAVICIQAALDFLNWRILPPRDLELSQKEGWIWVRPRAG